MEMNTRWPVVFFIVCLGGLFSACNLHLYPQPDSGTFAAITKLGTIQILDVPTIFPSPTGPILVVNTAADHDDGSCDAADCTLREAIRTANMAGNIIIRFNIPGSGVHTIQPGSALTAITKPTQIDGTSQPGYSGSPLIELDGSLVDPQNGNANGLDVEAGGEGSTIQGLAVNRFGACGINIAPEGVHILANYLGTDPSGTASLGNNFGICMQSGSNQIGGTTPAERNVISGNNIGIDFFKPKAGAANTVIQGNYIGTNASGTAALGNKSNGIQIYGAMDSGLRIGGDGAGGANVISGNGEDGIMINIGIAPAKIIVQHNLIGMAADGQGALGNGGNGVWVFGGEWVDILDNHIAHNAKNGIFAQTGKDAAQTPIDTSKVNMRRNSIHDNGKLGIAIDEDGVIPNDPLDADAGANHRQNFPDLASAVWASGQLKVKGTLSSSSGGVYAVDFYLNSSCDPSGYGEGQNALGSMSATANVNGLMMMAQDFPQNASAVGMYLTATATDMEGNTSEFSKCVLVTNVPPPPPPPTATAKPAPTNTPTLFIFRRPVPTKTPTKTLIPNPK
jgi:CSLREA domain-containing protein